MKIGLFFGSFNPVHIGHLIIGNSILEFVDEVWFVISPQNPFKKTEDLAAISFRSKMLRAAIKNNLHFKICEVELALSIPSYTINTLKVLKNLYSENEFFLIMGSDNYLDLPKWKGAELIYQYPIFIYKRPGFPLNEHKLLSNIINLKKPLLDISATELRRMIQNKKSVQYLIPDNVIKIIRENNLYYK